ncbi:hypothetical protein ACJX0J_009015, partial [Zea mays]
DIICVNKGIKIYQIMQDQVAQFISIYDIMFFGALWAHLSQEQAILSCSNKRFKIFGKNSFQCHYYLYCELFALVLLCLFSSIATAAHGLIFPEKEKPHSDTALHSSTTAMNFMPNYLHNIIGVIHLFTCFCEVYFSLIIFKIITYIIGHKLK